jgi:hypothetical protein
VRLFALSFLMLFVELALIRWTGANIIYLSYFSNFVLLGSFLGIGLGFLRARSHVDLFPWAPVALAALVLFVLLFPVQIDNAGSELLFFGSPQRTGLPIWATLPIVFLVVAAVMSMIAEGVARTFASFEPLEAYRLDILGSICGIAAFSTLSLLDAKPLAWGLVTALVFATLYGRRIGVVQLAALTLLIVLLGWESLASTDLWSPYYRISVTKPAGGAIAIEVNGIPHQEIESVANLRPFYSMPYRQAPTDSLRNVLIIGAGTGNDVAVALSEGAKHVDAVEIDPVLYRLGRALHPDHPYQDPRVSVHIDDGRAFVQRTKTRYDMILFALPDSLTLVSGQSSLRLESYLFTEQAVEAAKAHLEPSDGVFAMYNFYRTAWLRDRLANTLRIVFGHAPCERSTLESSPLTMLTVGVSPGAVRCSDVSHRTSDVVPPATDDHPFVYLKGRSIPGFYLLALGLILATSLLLIRGVAGPLRRIGSYLDLFFMGAAFLLLETKSVVQFALLFGTTWFVNALVFAGVLVSILAAVHVASRVELRRPGPLYAAVFVALGVAWAVPAAALLALPFWPRLVAAVSIAFAPIFLANLVFSRRFRETGDPTLAFAANLLGAMLGGVLEYASLVVGYRSLLLVVAALYGIAFLLGGRRLPGRGRLRAGST